MKRLMSKVKRPRGDDAASSNGTGEAMRGPQGDHPDAIVAREVISFCESGAPGSNTAGEEYLHLPAIVDGAESSPTAAKEAANTIRRYLSKEHYSRGFAQYNAVMLLRILTDNPGRNFTQNLGKEFVSTTKRLLRESPDQSVQQIVRETLDYFEAEKAPSNDTLGPLMEMWRKEKGAAARLHPPNMMGPGGQTGAPPRRSRGLPPPDELAGRIEEAKTTARLLLQTMQSTPANELAANELVREFSARARSAQKSIQGYMHSEDPRPDDDTMLTLIETNEQLNVAMTKHQRALLQAKKQQQEPLVQVGNNYSRTEAPVLQMPQLPRRENQAFAGTGEAPGATGQKGYHSPVSTASTHEPTFSTLDRPSSGFGAGYAAPPGPPPTARRPVSNNSDGRTENPFTDDAGYDDSPQPKSYSLFGRTPNANAVPATEPTYKPYSPPAVTDNPYSTPSSELRPGGVAYGQSTQSYLNRQESATNNLTMHGASPPQGPTK